MAALCKVTTMCTAGNAGIAAVGQYFDPNIGGIFITAAAVSGVMAGGFCFGPNLFSYANNTLSNDTCINCDAPRA